MVKRWKMATQAEFFNTLANLLKSGFSLTAALKFMAETDNHLKKGVVQIMTSLETGSDFSQAVRPLIDTQAYYQLMIAETHGQLENVLRELATFNRLKMKQVQKIKSMMVYPLFLGGILLILMIVIHFFIMPQIAGLLPNISEGQKSGISPVVWVTLVSGGSMLLGMGCYWFCHQTPLVKAGILVRLPLVGHIFQRYIAYYLASNLATLLRNGLSPKEIFKVLSAQHRNSLIFALGQRLNSALIKGSSLKRIVTANKFIPREIVTFMSSGETVPEMANSMAAYAKLMFEEIINRTNRLIGLIQPAMFLIIGVTIVFTYFQLLLPIYDSVKEMY